MNNDENSCLSTFVWPAYQTSLCFYLFLWYVSFLHFTTLRLCALLSSCLVNQVTLLYSQMQGYCPIKTVTYVNTIFMPCASCSKPYFHVMNHVMSCVPYSILIRCIFLPTSSMRIFLLLVD